MPGIGLATFGPDLSFAAASIYITSQVPRNYQGSAGSLLATIQTLSGAIMSSVADSIAAKVEWRGGVRGLESCVVVGRGRGDGCLGEDTEGGREGSCCLGTLGTGYKV